jgi:hypothetical protein
LLAEGILSGLRVVVEIPLKRDDMIPESAAWDRRVIERQGEIVGVGE